MNYKAWNWLIAYSYQRKLITREKFISLWATVQYLKSSEAVQRLENWLDNFSGETGVIE